MVDSLGLGPSVERRTGSSPVPFTKIRDSNRFYYGREAYNDAENS